MFTCPFGDTKISMVEGTLEGTPSHRKPVTGRPAVPVTPLPELRWDRVTTDAADVISEPNRHVGR